MNDHLKQAIEDHYGIRIRSLTQVPAGWSASAWKAETDRGDLFLKVYDRNKPTTQKWIARAALYLPIVLHLSQSTPLGAHIPAPILARDGSHQLKSGDSFVLAFPYIHGETVCESRLTRAEVQALAEIVAELHAHGPELPFPTAALKETFEVPFADSLIENISRVRALPEGAPHDAPDRLAENLSHVRALPDGAPYDAPDQLAENLSHERALPEGAPYDAPDQLAENLSHERALPERALLADRIAELRALARALRDSNRPFALVHTDIHGWNLMRAGRLMLIDWEGLMLAPPEADLFSFTDTFFFGYARDEFSAAYRAARGGCAIDPTALRFYRLRRRLDDIAEFASSILVDGLDAQARERSLYYLNRELDVLKRT